MNKMMIFVGNNVVKKKIQTALSNLQTPLILKVSFKQHLYHKIYAVASKLSNEEKRNRKVSTVQGMK